MIPSLPSCESAGASLSRRGFVRVCTMAETAIDYHKTLFAAAGHQAEAALRQAMRTHAGKHVCVVEGAIPTKENGIPCMIGDRTALEIVNDRSTRLRVQSVRSQPALPGRSPAASPVPGTTPRRGMPLVPAADEDRHNSDR
jgi:hydrogenase small subunit